MENNKGSEILIRVEGILKEMYDNRKDSDLINLAVNWASLGVVEIFERKQIYPSGEKELSYNVVIEEVSPNENEFSTYLEEKYFKKYKESISVITEW